jgi:hypothetical protein
MLVSLAATFCLVFLLLAAYGLGRWLLDGLSLSPADALARTVWSVSLGLVAAGLVLMGLGFARLLYAPLILALTVVGALAALRRILAPLDVLDDGGDWTTPSSLVEGKIDAYATDESRRKLHGAHVPAPREEGRTTAPQPPRWLSELLLVLAAVAAGAAFVSALAPPTDGDALCYHLELPKVFLAEHAIVYLPDSANSSYPLLAELWFLWGLALQGPVTAQLIHWSLGVLLALATYVLARPLLGEGWGTVCGCLLLLVPGITNQMTAPLNDVAVAAFTTLALAAWWRFAVEKETGHWPILAGLMLGGALSIKLTALVFAAGMGLVGLVMLWRSERRGLLLRQTAVMALVALSTAGTWYARSAWHTGDPLFPVLSQHLLGRDGAVDQSHKRPSGWQPTEVAAAPWQVTMHPERFGGRSHQFGAIFLAALPGLLIARRLRGLGVFLGIAAVYALLWYALRQNVRFLFPIAPLLIAPVAWVWAETARLPRPARLAATMAFLALAAPGAAISIARASGHWAVACGWQSREDYLVRGEPTYEPAQTVNALLPPEARIFSQEQRAYYFERSVVREKMYRRRTAYQESAGQLGWLERLREDGFTHLLLADTASEGSPRAPGVLDRLVEAEEARREAPPWRELACWRRELDGAQRTYRLLELSPAADRVASGK